MSAICSSLAEKSSPRYKVLGRQGLNDGALAFIPLENDSSQQ